MAHSPQGSEITRDFCLNVPHVTHGLLCVFLFFFYRGRLYITDFHFKCETLSRGLSFN